MNTITRVFCKAATDSCVLTPDGLISSCYEVLFPEDDFSGVFIFGRFDPVENKIVADRKKQEILNGMTIDSNPKCQRCFCRYHCAGDCPLKSLAGDKEHPGAITERSKITRALTKDQIVKELHLDS